MEKIYHVLSLDGGGIRGVFTATILTKIEERLGGKKIGECFDLVAGTSTGGILACLLLLPGEDGKPRFCARDTLDFYLSNGAKIFDVSWSQWIQSGAGIIDEKYSSDNIKELIDEYAKGVELKDLIHDCLITSYDTEKREIHLYKSHKARKDTTHNCLINEVALATSAAPTYFEPVLTSSNKCLIDGGMFATNPSMCAFVEARKLCPDKLPMMLSVGTGREERPYSYDDIKDYGLIEWIQPIIKILFGAGADSTEYFTERMFRMNNQEDHYYRINVQLTKEEAEMDDTSSSNLRHLQKLAHEEFDRLDKLGVIDRLVQDLV